MEPDTTPASIGADALRSKLFEIVTDVYDRSMQIDDAVYEIMDIVPSAAAGLLATNDALRAQLAEAQRDAEVSTQINRACAELPDDYRIVIEIERDAGWVCLLRRSEDMDFDDPCEDIASSISAAFDAAKGEPS